VTILKEIKELDKKEREHLEQLPTWMVKDYQPRKTRIKEGENGR